MKSSTKSTKKYIKNNIVTYIHKDAIIYLKITKPLKTNYILWYQLVRCILQIKYNTINLREEAKHSITTLQVPALLLKQIGLLKNTSLTDENNHRLKKTIFKAYDIEQTLKSPSTESMNSIFDASFSTLFAESEGWKSKEFAPYLNKLYTLIYKDIDKSHVSNVLSAIKKFVKKRENKYKLYLRKTNDIKRAERQLVKDRLGKIPILRDSTTKPKNNFESNDEISIVGSIISILILLKRFHLQYIERKLHSSHKYINLELCRYDKNKARSCKISLYKLLKAYMAESIHHTDLGHQFRAILLFNASITKDQEMQTILWLARMEAAFTTPLDIVKRFIFYCHDAWLPLPVPTSKTNLEALGAIDLNLKEKSFPNDWSWENFLCWPDLHYALQLKSKETSYTGGYWASILMEDYYIESLKMLMMPPSPIDTKFTDRFYIMIDYITLLSSQPNFTLESMPDLAKALNKSDDKNILWTPINRFSSAVAEMEMMRIHQQEINHINTVNQLQKLIDNSLVLFNKLYNDINTCEAINNLNLNTKLYEVNNNRSLARYITESNNSKTIKNFINWPSSHQQHIKYYITSIIERLLPFIPDQLNKDAYHKKAYLISLKLLYKIYKNSRRVNKNKAVSKRQLFPNINNYNDLTKVLKQYLFEPIITCILFNLNPQYYFYLPLKIKIKRYRKFVDFLYQSETLSLTNNLIRK